MLTRAQHLAHQRIFRGWTLAFDLTGLHVRKQDRRTDQFIRPRQTHPVGLIQAVEQINAFDRAVLTMIVMPTDPVLLVRMRLWLDRIIHDQHPIGLLQGADQRLDLRPKGAAIVVSRRQKARDLIVAVPPPSTKAERPVAGVAPNELSR